MSLLTICQNVADEVGVEKPTSIVGNNNETALRLLALANASGKRLSRQWSWQALVKEASFTTVATESQGALTTIASDFDRLLNETIFNRSQFNKVDGPLSAANWQFDKGTTASNVYKRFRIRGGELLLLPTPTAGENVFFEYVSNKWAKSSGGTAQTSFLADTDTTVLDEYLIELDVKWRFLKSLGLDYAVDRLEFEKQLELRKGEDGGKSVMDMTEGDHMVAGLIIPDGNWYV